MSSYMLVWVFYNQLNLRNIMFDVKKATGVFPDVLAWFYRQIKIDHPTSEWKHTEAERPMWTNRTPGSGRRCGGAETESL